MQLSELSVNQKDSEATICINNILQKKKCLPSKMRQVIPGSNNEGAAGRAARTFRRSSHQKLESAWGTAPCVHS